jgi:hypothetical protein
MRIQICYVDAEDQGCEDTEVYTDAHDVQDWHEAAEHASDLEDDDYVVLSITCIDD